MKTKLLLILLGGLAFFWLVVMRLLAKVFGYRRCPYALAWTVDNPLRRWYTRRVLDQAGVRPGEQVLELGCGPGAFTPDAARRVGAGGRLVAADVQPRMVRRARTRARQAGLTDVETLVADACHLPLGDGSMDRAFLITVLPEVADPVAVLAELQRVLKSGGVVSITEEILSPSYALPRTVVRWAAAAGWEQKERHGNWWLYTLNFQKQSNCSGCFKNQVVYLKPTP